MNSINKTMYIPLYGKAYVSRKGLFLSDKKAEEIWSKAAFPLKGKAKSKWLAYYMGIRSAVFDDWVKAHTAPDTVVIHVGCGLDSRVLRVNTTLPWYDVDFPEVLAERKRYYAENEFYHMLAGDVRNCEWLSEIPKAKHAIVVMEGVSMYVTVEDLRNFTANLDARFEKIDLLTDCYSTLAAKLSKYKNPVKSVGVNEVYGLDDPTSIQSKGLVYTGELDMTPQGYIDELQGFEKRLFRKLYAGKFSKKLYKLFTYHKG